MSVELNSRSLIYHINGLKSHLQACSPFGPRKLGPFHKRARKTRKRTTIVFLRKITRRVRRRFHEANFIVIPRLATSRLANIFGSSTIYRHDKKLKRAKIRDTNQINRALAAKAQARFEVPKALSTPEPEEIARRTLRKFMRSHANGRNIFAVTEQKKRCDLLHQNFFWCSVERCVLPEKVKKV